MELNSTYGWRTCLLYFRMHLETFLTSTLAIDGEPLIPLTKLGENRSGLSKTLESLYHSKRLDSNTHNISGSSLLTLLLFLNKAGNTGAHLDAYLSVRKDVKVFKAVLSNALVALKKLNAEDPYLYGLLIQLDPELDVEFLMPRKTSAGASTQGDGEAVVLSSAMSSFPVTSSGPFSYSSLVEQPLRKRPRHTAAAVAVHEIPGVHSAPAIKKNKQESRKAADYETDCVLVDEVLTEGRVKTWVCSRCTYADNEENTLFCVLCDTDK